MIAIAIASHYLGEAAQVHAGDAEAVYAALGKVPRCKQCFELADSILNEERLARQLPACVPS
jgi:bacterioferritin-associated ferredoxin